MNKLILIIMKYPKTAVVAALSLVVAFTSCLSPRAQEFMKAAAPLVVSISEVGELTGHMPPGTSVVIGKGAAVVTNDAKGIEKLMALKDLGLDEAVKEGALKPGDKLVVDKLGTSLVQVVENVQAIKKSEPVPGTAPPSEPLNTLLPPEQPK